MTLAPPGSISQVNLTTTSSSDPWGALHVHVLPLFNGEPLRIPMYVVAHVNTWSLTLPQRRLE